MNYNNIEKYYKDGSLIYFTIGASILGFFMAIFILFIPFSDSTFFELDINNKKVILSKFVNEKIININDKILSYYKEKEQLNNLKKKNKKTADSSNVDELTWKMSLISSKITTLQKILPNYIELKNDLAYKNSDIDSTFYTKYFFIDKDVLLNSLNDESLKIDSDRTINTVKYSIVIPLSFSLDDISPASSEVVKLNVIPAKNKIAFINKYPIFGSWVVLSISQMSLWFFSFTILLIIAKSSLKQIQFTVIEPIKPNCDPTIPGDGNILTRDYIHIIIAITVIFIIFLYCIYGILIDNQVISDYYFLNSFNLRTNIFAIVGYLVASFCLYIYLIFSFEAITLDNKIALQESTDAKIVLFKSDDLKKRLCIIKDNLDYSFGFCALILSVFVIWMGVMFRSINSLNLMNYYEQVSGRPFLNNDFVYLIASLHSLLLLFFYIPAKISYSSLDIVKNNSLNDPNESDKSPWYTKIFTNISENLLPVLITTSPLITSFFQKLITDLFI